MFPHNFIKTLCNIHRERHNIRCLNLHTRIPSSRICILHTTVSIISSVILEDTCVTSWIKTIRWVIPAIRKHIIPQEALTSAGVAVCVEEAAQGGVVVAALQVVEACLRCNLLPARAASLCYWSQIGTQACGFSGRGNRGNGRFDMLYPIPL